MQLQAIASRLQAYAAANGWGFVQHTPCHWKIVTPQVTVNVNYGKKGFALYRQGAERAGVCRTWNLDQLGGIISTWYSQALAAAEAGAASKKPVTAEQDPPGVHHVILVHDRNCRGSAMYVDGGLSTQGAMSDTTFFARVAADLQGLRMDFSVITVAKPADEYFPTVFDKCMLWQPQDYDPETAVVPQPQPAAVVAPVVEPVVVTIVQCRHTYRQALYICDSLRTTGKPVPATTVSEQMGDVPVVFRFLLTKLGQVQQFPMRLEDCNTTPATLEQFKADADAATAELKPTSTEWAAKFVEANGRFPHAIDYENAGYARGSQCDCKSIGDCVLRDATVNHCDRNCYTQQLKDYIVLSGRKAKCKPPSPELKITVAGLVASGKTTVSCVIAEALRRYGVSAEVVDQDGELPPPQRVSLCMRTLAARGLTVTIDQKQLQWGGTCKNQDTP